MYCPWSSKQEGDSDDCRSDCAFYVGVLVSNIECPRCGIAEACRILVKAGEKWGVR